MVAGRPKLGRFLIERGIITQEQLDAAIQYQTSNGCRLGNALVTLGYCNDAAVARALAEQLDIRFVDLEATPPSPECVALLAPEVALSHGVLPIRMEGNRLLLAARDPFDIRSDDVVRQATGLPVILATAPESQLLTCLHQQYSDSLVDTTPATPEEETDDLGIDEEYYSVEKLLVAGEQLSTVRLVNLMLADAVRRGASDVHIEPEPSRVRVRYRIDGRMCAGALLPIDMHSSVVARIKILCGMDISESRLPQDGSCSRQVDGRTIELRASTLRGVHGEIVVLRLLCQDAARQQLDALGLQPEMHRAFHRLLAARHGLILTTGPTGSGKTTTLYAALNHLNREDVNIMTVEDPVESKLPGINQIQVHDRAGRSFAATLRSMLRQDPDIIMVGEIRDAETAEIACRAALTGHLVLSTLHTHHTLGTVARLLDMGLQPWMLGACLNGVIAQRLARRVCEECACDYTLPPSLARALTTQFGSLRGARFRRGTGCSACHRTGTRGRVGIYEILEIDETMRDLLSKAAEPETLRAHATPRGFTTMERDAFAKACQGLIAPEEVISLGFSVARSLAETAIEREEP